jgi:ADP-ribose pyrophosphatase
VSIDACLADAKRYISATMSERILVETKFLRCIDRDGWFFVERPNAKGVVTIVPLLSDGRIVLIEQFRAPVGRMVVELPAGLVGDDPAHDGEGLEGAARRELIEETGYDARRWTRLASCTTSPGIVNEIAEFFLATDLVKVGDGGGTDDEEIRVHEVPLADVPAWLQTRAAAGSLISVKIYAALYFAQAAAK